jgi:hypothetical protein
MATAGRKFGLGIAALGLFVVAAGVFAGGASAGTNEPTSPCVTSLKVSWDQVDLAAISSATGQSFSDGDLKVTVSNATAIPGQSLTILTVGALDFATSKTVPSVALQLWQSAGVYTYTTLTFSPEVSSGHIVSPAGSHPTLGQAPIKGLEFCYQRAVAATTTVAPTTAAPTTVVQVIPEVIVAPTTTTTTTAPIAVQVLPQVVTAPQVAPQLAFTGSDSGLLIVIGALLLLFGISLVGVDHLGVFRPGRHSR